MSGSLGNVATIARVELRRFLREKGNVFFVFILPLALIVFIGLQFGGQAGTQLGVVLEVEDDAARDLVERLDAAGGLSVVEVDDQEGLTDLVSRANLSGGIVVPSGYGAALELGERIDIGFVGRPDPGSRSLRAIVAAEVAEQTVTTAAARDAAETLGASVADLLPVATQVRSELPRVEVTTEQVGGDELTQELQALGQFDLGASSQLFLFVFLTSLAGSGALIQTRQYGVASRMLSTPTRLPVILAGIGGGRFAIALFQALYIIVLTAVAFRVDWGDPLTTGLLVLLFCLVSAAAGMVLGALFRNDAQASGAGVGIGLVTAALGGSMVLLDFFPEGMRRVALLTPHGWANTAMAEIVRRDGTVADVAVELGALAAMAAGLLLLATWLLRRAITR